ncbi:MAG TPA: hypothetical protein VG206_04620 [Terriglobia bacterium]|nr:hypothetical protein [Terriglobia bacterium]
METQYDLFEMKADGFPQWVGAAASLEHARIRLWDLAQSSIGSDYFVRDFCSGSVVAVSGPPQPGLARPTLMKSASSLAA